MLFQPLLPFCHIYIQLNFGLKTLFPPSTEKPGLKDSLFRLIFFLQVIEHEFENKTVGDLLTVAFEL